MFLNSLTQWASLPAQFKLIITSRNDRLPTSFRDICKTLVLETGSLVSGESTSDIHLFLKYHFKNIAHRYPSLYNWPGESTIKLLTRRSAGFFIWAETLIRFVGDEECLPREQLHQVLDGDFCDEGETINRLYQRILDVSFGRSKDRILHAFRMVVGTIILAKIPL